MSGGDNNRVDPFDYAVKIFSAKRTWELTEKQAARMRKYFSEKGPVLVRYKLGKFEKWLSAEEFLGSSGNKRGERR